LQLRYAHIGRWRLPMRLVSDRASLTASTHAGFVKARCRRERGLAATAGSGRVAARCMGAVNYRVRTRMSPAPRQSVRPSSSTSMQTALSRLVPQDHSCTPQAISTPMPLRGMRCRLPSDSPHSPLGTPKGFGAFASTSFCSAPGILNVAIVLNVRLPSTGPDTQKSNHQCEQFDSSDSDHQDCECYRIIVEPMPSR
jgi:hypothetical protein